MRSYRKEMLLDSNQHCKYFYASQIISLLICTRSWTVSYLQSRRFTGCLFFLLCWETQSWVILTCLSLYKFSFCLNIKISNVPIPNYFIALKRMYYFYSKNCKMTLLLLPDAKSKSGIFLRYNYTLTIMFLLSYFFTTLLYLYIHSILL